MIVIDNILVSDQIIEEQFVCNIIKCKGACCVDGDAGAPLQKEELDIINKVYDKVLPYLSPESKNELEKQGQYVYNKDYGWVTPTIGNKICVYGIMDNTGIVKCGIEQACLDGKIKWKKPLSCHLFPVIIKESNLTNNVYVNYEPREDNCKAACSLGKKLKIPVYNFLRDALIRKFGQKFYTKLEAIAKRLKK